MKNLFVGVYFRQILSCNYPLIILHSSCARYGRVVSVSFFDRLMEITLALKRFLFDLAFMVITHNLNAVKSL